MLEIRETLPDGFLDVSARELHRVLSGPTLIHLAGRREQPLFTSILLHGNEDVGLAAIQQLLRKYERQELPRSLSIFVGNVAAAKEGVRRLAGQPDYNRIWPGTEEEDTNESRMARQVVDEMRGREVFASVDLHNNTGLNPHYACVNRLGSEFLQLATLFGRTVVYFLRPRGVQSLAFAELCPAVTLECGRVGDEQGIRHAMEYVDACLHLSAIPEHPVAPHDIDLFHTVATVKIPEDVSFSIGREEGDIRMVEDIEWMNFRELQPGTVLGKLADNGNGRLMVQDEAGCEVVDKYFDVEEQQLRLRRSVMPSMLTVNEEVVRQDCLCYLMERYPLPDSA